ncbi:MAG: ATP cone domain-containing protein [Acidithiobacillus sp.]
MNDPLSAPHSHELIWPSVLKRNGARVPFDPDRICSAITRAGRASGEFDGGVAERITDIVLSALAPSAADREPAIEQIQDLVE